jgi:hypothetical protein
MVMRCKWVYLSGICNGIVIFWSFSKAFGILIVLKMKFYNDAYVL